jgi:hypothetical protein
MEIRRRKAARPIGSISKVSGLTRFETRLKRRGESCQLPKRNRLANFAHDVKVKVEIVVGVQDCTENLVGKK